MWLYQRVEDIEILSECTLFTLFKLKLYCVINRVVMHYEIAPPLIDWLTDWLIYYTPTNEV